MHRRRGGAVGAGGGGGGHGPTDGSVAAPFHEQVVVLEAFGDGLGGVDRLTRWYLVRKKHIIFSHGMEVCQP